MQLDVRERIEDALVKRAKNGMEAVSIRQLMKEASMARKMFMALSVSPMLKNIMMNILNTMLKESQEEKQNFTITLFKNLGDDMKVVAKKFDAFEKKIDESKDEGWGYFDKLDQDQDELMNDMDWTTAADSATKQEQKAYIAAVDHLDEICPGFRMYNVCTCKDPANPSRKCGFAFPNKFWLAGEDKNRGVPAQVSRIDGMTVGKRYGWKCRCEWANVEAAAFEQPKQRCGAVVGGLEEGVWTRA